MFKRTVSGVLIVLLVLSMLLLAFDIQPAKASGTIYIRADGRVEPSTAPILTVDNVTYALTNDIDDSIVVERNNIIVDGAGYTIQGLGAYNSRGMYLLERSNVTIKNMEIKAFEYGIRLDYSSNSTLIGNNITNNSFGIRLGSSFRNFLFENNVINNGFGVVFDSSSNNSLLDNTIVNNNYHGVYFYFSSFNTISGNNIANGSRGIYFDYSSNNSIDSNSITNTSIKGIRFYASHENTISEKNKIANNPIGIHFYLSSNNSVSENNVTNNKVGTRLYRSSGNRFYHNNFIENIQQVYIETSGYSNFWDDDYPSGGNYWSDYEGRYPNAMEVDDSGIWNTPYVIDESNQDNYPLIHPYGSVQNLNTSLTYLTIQSAINAPETLDGHTIFVRNGTYIENIVVNKILSLFGENRKATIIDGNLAGNVVTIQANNVTLNNFAIQNSPDSTTAGIFLSAVQHCVIENNNITNNWRGIGLSGSYYNKIYGNNLRFNVGQGIGLSISSNNILSDNNMSNNSQAIVLDWSYDNTVSENSIAYNNVGMYIGWGTYNIVCHNNFIGNIYHQAYTSESRINFWDNSYPSGGNYWSDYAGVDLFRGSYQNFTGSDGIGDIPYVVPNDWNDYVHANDFDHYPLMNPWTPDTAPPSITILSPQNTTYTTPSVPLTFIVNESTSWVGYILDNQANVTISGNTTLTGLSLGQHGIRVYANDTSGNMGSSSIVYFTVTFLGDINGDGTIDIYDLVTIAISFGSRHGDPQWNEKADLYKDGIIDIFDIVIIGINFGKTWTP